MRITKLLPALLIAAAAAIGGCYGSATYSDGYTTAGIAVYDPPPAPRVVVTPAPRPGFVFIQGRWIRNSNRWAWRDGYWVRERPGYVYNPGRWTRRPSGGYVYVEGRWRPHRAGGRVYVR